jgi:hypothetical protein
VISAAGLVNPSPTVLDGLTKSSSTRTAKLGAEAPAIPSLAERLWNEAYNNLRDQKEPELVQEYEKILSHELKEDESRTASPEEVKNRIERDDPHRRRLQMIDVVNAGLKKTEKQAKVKGTIGTALEAITTVTQSIDKVISAVPQAALPWAVVTTTLQASLFL